jgi:hypothetical protein
MRGKPNPRRDELKALPMLVKGVEPEGRQWFPVAYIFHAGQVEGQKQEATA